MAVALVCTATASIAHVLAGGQMPVLAVTIVFGAASLVAWAVSSRRLTPEQVVGLLVLCQAFVHVGCSTGSMEMSGSMLATHAAATALSAMALARGESFVWRMAERLGIRLRPVAVVGVPILARRVHVTLVTVRSLRDIRLAYSRALRGPPYGLC